MSQHDLTIANQGFPAFRADLNNALQALGSTQSGTSAPSPTFANQLWYDTTNNILKIRNADNDAWISLLTLNQTSDTLSTLSTSADVSINGLVVGKGAGNVASNTAVGISALNANTTGLSNTAIGFQAGNGITTGNYNTAVGRATMSSTATSSGNSVFGYAAGNSITSGSDNTFLGGGGGTGVYGAGQTNSSGSFNTGVGVAALASNTTASKNTAVGYQSLYSNATAGSNSAIGMQTLYSNTTGQYNAAFGGEDATGWPTLFANTTGSNNTAFGFGSLAKNTTASNNTAVGYQAGYSQTTATRNINVGSQAGYSATTGSYNVFVGHAAGYNTTGGNNTFVGDASGSAVTTGTKNTIIGAYTGNQGGLDIRTASNYIVLSDGDGNPRGIFDGSGRFMVNTTTANPLGGVNWQTVIKGGNCFALNNTDTGGATTAALQSANYTGGASTIINFYNGSGNLAGTITVPTNASTGTNVAYNTSSDYRMKENIEPMTGALNKVLKLKPVTYTWKANGYAGQGFIAHELQEVVPDCVSGEKDAVDAEGNPIYQGVDTSFLVATLTAAIQELKAEVDSLKAQLNK